jgi:hypothetical protein
MARCWPGDATLKREPMALRITQQGLDAIGVKDDATGAPTESVAGGSDRGGDSWACRFRLDPSRRPDWIFRGAAGSRRTVMCYRYSGSPPQRGGE